MSPPYNYQTLAYISIFMFTTQTHQRTRYYLNYAITFLMGQVNFYLHFHSFFVNYFYLQNDGLPHNSRDTFCTR